VLCWLQSWGSKVAVHALVTGLGPLEWVYFAASILLITDDICGCVFKSVDDNVLLCVCSCVCV
jgi:hypothetical protein